MLCACSGEQFKFEEPPQSPESLATRDFSASGLSSRTGDWESKFDDTQVDDVESTLKEALSLNYEVGILVYECGSIFFGFVDLNGQNSLWDHWITGS